MSKQLFYIGIISILTAVGSAALMAHTAYAQTCQVQSESVDLYVCPEAKPLPSNCEKLNGGEMSCEGLPAGYTTYVEGRMSAQPSEIEIGGTSLLSWDTRGTGTCNINGTPEPRVGSISVTPTKTATYQLRCTGVNGAGQSVGTAVQIQSVTVVVRDPSATAEDTRDTSEVSGAGDITVRDNNLTYVPLEPLVGVNQSGQAPFGDLISGFFRILINVGAFLAVVMFVVGGIIYMVSDSTFKKLKGKDTIKAALIGLAILAGAWLILNTINPQLIAFDKDFLQPAYSVTVTEKKNNLIRNGVERREVNSADMKKLQEKFNCPTDGRKCLWDEILIFDDNKASTSKVKKAIDQFKSDCRGTFGAISDWDVKSKPGTLVGAPKNTTVHVCKMS